MATKLQQITTGVGPPLQQTLAEETSSLAALISSELDVSSESEEPVLSFGQAGQSKKGEDYFLVETHCARTSASGDDGDASTFSVFAIFDGHNGRAAAIYSRDNVLKDVLSAMPPGLTRSEWSAALPRALVAGFVKTDKEFQSREQSSGTTVTFVIIDGWTVTVASVGDSRCIVESQGAISMLTVDHRLEVNEEERRRVKCSGGEVGRLSTVGGAEIGPLRCWPGGLCLSRSIGDLDVGEFIVPIPFVKQIRLSSSTGGRIIVASDGVWDALSSERAAKCCRGLSAELAANQVVKESLRSRGLRDDTTCLVVDVLPRNRGTAAVVEKKQSTRFFTSMFKKHRGTRLASSRHVEGCNVEEIFEEGSAVLCERLGSEGSVHGASGLGCAVCQVNITPMEGISVHSGTFFSTWEGPFLCVGCKQKQNAMEGRCPTRRMIAV